MHQATIYAVALQERMSTRRRCRSRMSGFTASNSVVSAAAETYRELGSLVACLRYRLLRSALKPNPIEMPPSARMRSRLTVFNSV